MVTQIDRTELLRLIEEDEAQVVDVYPERKYSGCVIAAAHEPCICQAHPEPFATELAVTSVVTSMTDYGCTGRLAGRLLPAPDRCTERI